MSDKNVNWSENVILVDATFMDELVFDFIVNFERMINRPLGKADLCRWLDCLLLDAGVAEGEHETFVAIIHPKSNARFVQFTPSDFATELTDQAFKDRLGEFTLCSFPVEGITTKDDFFLETVKAAIEAADTRRILVVGDMNAYGSDLCKIAEKVDNKEVTLFTMQQIMPGAYRQQILGYSVMSALGIRSDELK